MAKANEKPIENAPNLQYEIYGFRENGEDVNIPLSAILNLTDSINNGTINLFSLTDSVINNGNFSSNSLNFNSVGTLKFFNIDEKGVNKLTYFQMLNNNKDDIFIRIKELGSENTAVYKISEVIFNNDNTTTFLVSLYETLSVGVFVFGGNYSIDFIVENYQPDYNQTDSTKGDFIKNKPASHPKSFIEELETDLSNIESKRIEENQKLTNTDEIDLSSLETTDKTSIKNAINENKSRVDSNESDIVALQNNQNTGVASYTNLADLPLTGTANVSYKVTNDGIDSANNGYYTWDGAVYVKDAELVENIVNSSNTSVGVSGSAIFKEDEKIRTNLVNLQDGLTDDEIKSFIGTLSDTVSYNGSTNYTWVEATPYLGATIEEVQFKIVEDNTEFTLKVYSRNENTGLMTIQESILLGTFNIGNHTHIINVKNTYNKYVGVHLNKQVAVTTGVTTSGLYASIGNVGDFIDTTIALINNSLNVVYRGKDLKVNKIEDLEQSLSVVDTKVEKIDTDLYNTKFFKGQQIDLPTSADLTASSNVSWVLGEETTEANILKEFKLGAVILADLTFSLITLTRSGDDFTIKTKTDFTSVLGVNSLNVNIPLEVGDYLGMITPANAFKYNGSNLIPQPIYVGGANLNIGQSFTDIDSSNFAFPWQFNVANSKVDDLSNRLDVVESNGNSNGLPFDYNLILGVGQSLMEGSYTSGLPSQTHITTVQEYNTIGYQGRVNNNQLNPATVANTQIGTRGEWSGLACAKYLKDLLAENKGINPNNGNVVVLTNDAYGGSAITGISKGGSLGTFEVGIAKATQLEALTSANSGAIACIFMQGESDQSGDLEIYKSNFNQLIEDYANDLRTATGQFLKPKMYSYQLSTFRHMAIAHYESAENNPNIILAMPMYHLTYYDNLHIDAQAERLVGAYFAKAMYETLVDGFTFEPLKPINVDFSGNNVIITFNKKNLNLDTTLIPLQTDYGFNFSGGNITNVSIKNSNQVVLTIDTPPNLGDIVGYGNPVVNKSPQIGVCGNLRDNEGIVNKFDNIPLHNWSVVFDIEL